MSEMPPPFARKPAGDRGPMWWNNLPISQRAGHARAEMTDFLGELAILARDSVEVRALLREFLNSDRIIARCQIDDAATLAAGEVIMHSEPSEHFRDALAAVLAKQ